MPFSAPGVGYEIYLTPPRKKKLNMIFSEKFEVTIALHYRVHDAEIYGGEEHERETEDEEAE